jgi:hypothetical protein
MNRLSILTAVALAILALSLGCASVGTSTSPSLTQGASNSSPANISQTHLWGLYDVYIDIPNKTATATLNRSAMFTANVVNFVNMKASNLSFHINDTPVGTSWIDVDIDVSILHPFPGLPQYNGYDVRGVFMGDGSAQLAYNSDLVYPVLGTDQFMLPDPDDPAQGIGGPDGYTRWFNQPEFSGGGMPLFQYTHGKIATPGYSPSATLNPYKYFADGLDKDADLWTFLKNTPDQFGVFSSGVQNTRNYYLRFPTSKSVKFGYAIVANWTGAEPEFHPSNAPESVALSVADNSNIYFVDSSDKGGDLKLDIGVWNWDSQISAGAMSDYNLIIDSTVLSAPQSFTNLTPIGGTDNYSTYSFDIPADNITANTGNEYWVIIEQNNADYTNTFGVTNLADTDPLAAFFRYDLTVSPNPPTDKPICDIKVVTPMPYVGWGTLIEFDASASYDPGGSPLTFEWDFNNDGTFGDTIDQGTPDKPQKLFNNSYVGDVCVRVTDGSNQFSDCCVPVDITAHPSKNIPLRNGVDAMDIGVDHDDGDLLVLYSDGQIWKHLESDYYQTGTLFTSTGHPGANHIDVNPDSRFIVGGNNDQTVCWHASYDASGVLFAGSNWNGSPRGVYEVGSITYHTGGSYDCYNDQETVEDWPNQAPFADAHYVRWLGWADYHMGSGWYIWDGSGIGSINHHWIKGMEAAKTIPRWYILEGAPEYRVEQYQDGPSNFSYSGVTWGGTQSDTMSGFNDPRDLTRDSSENYYVLDKLTTGPAIKKYLADGTPVGQPFGGWGIAGDPIKIEGSDWVSPWDNLLFEIHSGTGSDPDMLSIFFKSEIP